MWVGEQLPRSTPHPHVCIPLAPQHDGISHSSCNAPPLPPSHLPSVQMSAEEAAAAEAKAAAKGQGMSGAGSGACGEEDDEEEEDDSEDEEVRMPWRWGEVLRRERGCLGGV